MKDTEWGFISHRNREWGERGRPISEFNQEVFIGQSASPRVNGIATPRMSLRKWRVAEGISLLTCYHHIWPGACLENSLQRPRTWCLCVNRRISNLRFFVYLPSDATPIFFFFLLCTGDLEVNYTWFPYLFIHLSSLTNLLPQDY